MKKLKKACLRALSFILAVTMIAVYSPENSIAADANLMGAAGNQLQPSDSGNGDFFVSGRDDGLLRKTATPVAGKDGYYDITLEMQPKKSTTDTTYKTTDIVLVIDKSNSMSKTYGIMQDVKDEARNLVTNVLGGNEHYVQVAVVGFSGPSTANANCSMKNSVVYQDFQNSTTVVNNYIQSNINAGGGTNTEAGFQKAYELLENSSAQQKFVVFLSDGNPTYRLTYIKGDGINGYGTGSKDSKGYNKDCAIAWAEALKAPVGNSVTRTVGGATVFSGKAGLGAKVFAIGYDGLDTFNYASEADTDGPYYYEVAKGGDFTPIFNNITSRIKKTTEQHFNANDVVLSDIVNEDFEIVSGAEEIKVYKDNQEITAQASINGNTVSVPFGDITSDFENHTYKAVFRVKLKDNVYVDAGTYTLPTNDEAKVSYNQQDDSKDQFFEVPYVTVQIDKSIYGSSKDARITSWDDRTYDITLQAWSNKVAAGDTIEKTAFRQIGTITPDTSTAGKSYLVYTGTGDNNPPSENPDDYMTATVNQIPHETVEGIEWYYYTYEWNGGGFSKTEHPYTGDIYTRSWEGLDGFRYSYVGNTSTYNPTGQSYYTGDPHELYYRNKVSTTYTYKWSDTGSENIRAIYEKYTYEETVGAGTIISITGANITDVVEDEFEVVGVYQADGTVDTEADLSGNKVTWTNQTLTGNEANPGWKRIIKVRAKDDYIGGNNVATNVEEESGIQIGKSPFHAFDSQPSVNVKVNLEVGNAENTIFLGESVPYDDQTKAQMKEDLLQGVTYVWDTNPSTHQTPAATGDIYYNLTASYAAGNPTDSSTANSGGHVNGTLENGYRVTASGTYTVHVIAGQLTVSKIVEDTTNMDPNQTFLFHVKSDTGVSFDVVLRANESKTITNLKTGTYTVTEDENWSWRYQADSTAYTNGQKLDKDHPELTASITNEKETDQWFGAYESVTNYFDKQ